MVGIDRSIQARYTSKGEKLSRFDPFLIPMILGVSVNSILLAGWHAIMIL